MCLVSWERLLCKGKQILKSDTKLKILDTNLVRRVESRICDLLLEEKINIAVPIRTALGCNLADWSGITVQKRALFATEGFFY